MFASCVCSCPLVVFGACPHLVTGCRSTQCGSLHFAPLRQSLRRDSGCMNMQPNLMQEAPCRQGVWGRGHRIALRGISSGSFLSSSCTVTFLPVIRMSLAAIHIGSEGWRLQRTIVPGLRFVLMSCPVLTISSYDAATRFVDTG